MKCLYLNVQTKITKQILFIKKINMKLLLICSGKLSVSFRFYLMIQNLSHYDIFFKSLFN